MTLQVDQKLFTRDDYHRMVEAGVLSENDKVELINGNILHMSPIGTKHLATVNRLVWLFNKILSDDFILSIQNPVGLNEYSEPEPDVAILNFKEDFYESGKPSPKDIHLIIEVSDTTLEKDQELKIPLYAKAGIPESWIVDLVNSQICVYKDPTDEGYTSKKIFHPNDLISVSNIQGSELHASKIFGF